MFCIGRIPNPLNGVALVDVNGRGGETEISDGDDMLRRPAGGRAPGHHRHDHERPDPQEDSPPGASAFGRNRE